ncbi:MAG TPA: hypothetical protein VGK17_03045 [Propionicimonas sp.]|jgi:hypothetical protein
MAYRPYPGDPFVESSAIDGQPKPVNREQQTVDLVTSLRASVAAAKARREAQAK